MFCQPGTCSFWVRGSWNTPVSCLSMPFFPFPVLWGAFPVVSSTPSLPRDSGFNSVREPCLFPGCLVLTASGFRLVCFARSIFGPLRLFSRLHLCSSGSPSWPRELQPGVREAGARGGPSASPGVRVSQCGPVDIHTVGCSAVSLALSHQVGPLLHVGQIVPKVPPHPHCTFSWASVNPGGAHLSSWTGHVPQGEFPTFLTEGPVQSCQHPGRQVGVPVCGVCPGHACMACTLAMLLQCVPSRYTTCGSCSVLSGEHIRLRLLPELGRQFTL